MMGFEPSGTHEFHTFHNGGDFACLRLQGLRALCKMMAAKRAACEKAERGLYHYDRRALTFIAHLSTMGGLDGESATSTDAPPT